MNNNLMTEGLLSSVFKPKKKVDPSKMTNEEKLKAMQDHIAKQNKVNNNVDNTLNKMNAKFGLKTESSGELSDEELKRIGHTVSGIINGLSAVGSAISLKKAKSKLEEIRGIIERVQGSLDRELEKAEPDERLVRVLRGNLKSLQKHEKALEKKIKWSKVSAGVNTVGAAYSFGKAYKESSITDTKLRLYESCDNGFITVEERDNYLEILESFSDQKKYNKYSSPILDPGKLFKTGDNKYYVDCSNFKEIDNRPDIQKAIVKIKSVAMTAMIKHAKDLYPDWYEDVDSMKFSEVKELMIELFDIIGVRDKGEEVYVSYWINGHASHKRSMYFFADYSMDVEYSINKKDPSKYKEIHKPNLQG